MINEPDFTRKVFDNIFFFSIEHISDAVFHMKFRSDIGTLYCKTTQIKKLQRKEKIYEMLTNITIKIIF